MQRWQASRQSKSPRLAEDALVARVVTGGVEVEVVRADTAAPAVLPPGQRACLLAHVPLGIRAAVGTEREQLHHLAAVVLVRRALLVLEAVQPFEHRGVRRDVAQQVVERARARACGTARSAGASASGCRRRRSTSRTSRARSASSARRAGGSSAPCDRATRRDRRPTRSTAPADGPCRRAASGRRDARSPGCVS